MSPPARIDEFAAEADGVITERDRIRLVGVGFEATQPSRGPADFRLDEFAAVADGELDAADRTRMACMGFDRIPASADRYCIDDRPYTEVQADASISTSKHTTLSVFSVTDQAAVGIRFQDITSIQRMLDTLQLMKNRWL